MGVQSPVHPSLFIFWRMKRGLTVDELNDEIMIGFVHQTLVQLFESIPIKTVSPEMIPAVPVTGIAFDSRAVQPGQVFVALVGGNTDGHLFIPAAVERGAVAVIGTQPVTDLHVPYIRVEDTARHWLTCRQHCTVSLDAI